MLIDILNSPVRLYACDGLRIQVYTEFLGGEERNAKVEVRSSPATGFAGLNKVVTLGANDNRRLQGWGEAYLTASEPMDQKKVEGP